jgi:hypothetical protein
MAEMKRMSYKPSEQPVSRGMFEQAHTKCPTLMERQFNQRDPVPMVGKAVSVSPTAKAKANKNDRVAAMKGDEDCVEITNAPKG